MHELSAFLPTSCGQDAAQAPRGALPDVVTPQAGTAQAPESYSTLSMSLSSIIIIGLLSVILLALLSGTVACLLRRRKLKRHVAAAEDGVARPTATGPAAETAMHVMHNGASQGTRQPTGRASPYATAAAAALYAHAALVGNKSSWTPPEQPPGFALTFLQASSNATAASTSSSSEASRVPGTLKTRRSTCKTATSARWCVIEKDACFRHSICARSTKPCETARGRTWTATLPTRRALPRAQRHHTVRCSCLL